MILYKIEFGPVTEICKHEAEDIAYGYTYSLKHNGQACGEQYLTIQNGKLCVYINLTGRSARSLKYHSEYGINELEKATIFFGQTPTFTCLEDNEPTRDTLWTNSSLLFLQSRLCEIESPLFRGDNDKRIPIYRLMGKDEKREKIYRWLNEYQLFQNVWLNSGQLEIDAYRQITEPGSDISLNGREICEWIEKVTNVPTYYYLFRFWGRRKNEEKRKCPGCGGFWRHTIKKNKIYKRKSYELLFKFQCVKCRLISNPAQSFEDERHARIGEWKDKKK